MSWMSRSSLFCAALGLSLVTWGCTPATDGDGTQEGTGSSCNGGKCDSATASLSELQALTDLSLGTCALTGRAEEVVVECAVSALPEATQVQHVITIVRVEGSSNFNDTEILREDVQDGQFRDVISVARADIEGETFAINFETHMATEQGSTFAFRQRLSVASLPADGEQEVKVLETPMELWPVSFWPGVDVIDAFTSGTIPLMLVSSTLTSDFSGVDGFSAVTGVPMDVRDTWTLHASSDDPLSFSGQVHYFPVVRGGTGATIVSEVIFDVDNRIKHELTAPGYYVIGADNSLTLTALADLPENGWRPPAPSADMGDVGGEGDMATDDAGIGGGMDMGSVDMAPDMVDMPPVDPCQGACSAGQVCVAAQCVDRSDQAQFSCSSTPSKACDLGEDEDCAMGNVCVEGTCHQLACQAQFSCSATPNKACETDGHCADGNVCVENVCRQLACQSQFSCSTTPNRPCDVDAHCASGNSCVDAVCKLDVCM